MAAVAAPRRVEIPYKPRPLQAVIHTSLEQYRFGIVVCHRRFGKTVCAVNHLQRAAVECTRERPRFGYIAPTYAQGKAVAWSYMKHFAAPIPGRSVNESELRIDYPNGSQVRIFGADNPDSLRGLYFDGVVLDEYALMRPETWGEVIRPTLSDRQGWALFLGTPKGKNEFWRLLEKARGNPEWFVSEYRASQTGYVSEAELDSAKASMSEDEYLQEYECSFEASVKGAVYAKEILALRAEHRLGKVPYDPALPVHTDWDIGYRDATAIWFSQSAYGGTVRLIDYYENTGYALDHYIREVQSKPYVYDTHWFPHDAQQKEYLTGKSVIEVAQVGLKNVQIVPQLEVSEGIHAVRLLFPKLYVDEDKCRIGVGALGSYRWHFNTNINAFTNRPEHDWASHASDALRTLAVRYDPAIKKVQRESKRDELELAHQHMLRREYGYLPTRRSVGRGGY